MVGEVECSPDLEVWTGSGREVAFGESGEAFFGRYGQGLEQIQKLARFLFA